MFGPHPFSFFGVIGFYLLFSLGSKIDITEAQNGNFTWQSSQNCNSGSFIVIRKDFLIIFLSKKTRFGVEWTSTHPLGLSFIIFQSNSKDFNQIKLILIKIHINFNQKTHLILIGGMILEIIPWPQNHHGPLGSIKPLHIHFPHGEILPHLSGIDLIWGPGLPPFQGCQEHLQGLGLVVISGAEESPETEIGAEGGLGGREIGGEVGAER